MKPMLDPARDLAGATPETLARALLRNRNLRPRPGRQPVVGGQVAVEKVPADEPGDGSKSEKGEGLAVGLSIKPLMTSPRQTPRRGLPYSLGIISLQETCLFAQFQVVRHALRRIGLGEVWRIDLWAFGVVSLAADATENLENQCHIACHDRPVFESPFGATRSQYSKFRPTNRATVSRIWTRVPESRMLCLPANSET